MFMVFISDVAETRLESSDPYRSTHSLRMRLLHRTILIWNSEIVKALTEEKRQNRGHFFWFVKVIQSLPTTDPYGYPRGKLSRYSDGLRAGRPGFGSRLGTEIFLNSTGSRPALGSTQPPIQWVPELFPRE
jgi:hypothetical protein